ncbi:NAD+ diphosphatase [Geothermobacter ehrlichii]|uniref:NAD(+) diphosphatase n=1 Tax=Geothermobacter ehrlichii TaxID=213224 RepID=A0A5D3WJ33_9BACT|nr:NAD(+) diphosphatase [Geothermobacter ehrlichii]TYO98936.1 NAD+ diphosphatase [Geothermobacter ehrlichii]
MLPDRYPSPLHLPFNRSCLQRRFHLAPPDADPGGPGRLLVLQRGAMVVSVADSHLPAGDDAVPQGVAPDRFIGYWDDSPCRLRVLSGSVELPAGLQAQSLLASDPRLPLDLLSLGGVGMQLARWLKTSRFCGGCGGETCFLPGEWGRSCPACGDVRFPQVAPCVIVLVRRANQVLLTRKADWAPGRYSLVAGFVDVGECLEEAVMREVAEETGVRVANIRYVGSQSWPFPSQLMVGFVADWTAGELRVDRNELEDARWFDVDRLPVLPPKRSIARYILDTCLPSVGG